MKSNYKSVVTADNWWAFYGEDEKRVNFCKRIACWALIAPAGDSEPFVCGLIAEDILVPATDVVDFQYYRHFDEFTSREADIWRQK